MVLATKSMGLNPNVLSFAYSDMSSVSSPRRPQKNISLGTERLVQFYSSDPEDLGIEIEHSHDGYVRIASAAEDGMFQGTVHAGDIVCEIAGVNMRRPITEHMWKLTTGLMKVAPKPIEVIVAAEHVSQEGDEETLCAVGSVPKKKSENNIDADVTQSPSLVKQAMTMWQNLNLNGASKEEHHESPGTGTSDTSSMSDGNEGSIVQLPDPYNDPERFGVERNIIFHTESLGIKLHRCPDEGIVQIWHVDEIVSEKVRCGDDGGRLEVGDVIVEVGGVDLRHKFIGPLEWADMVYFVQNVGRPLDIVVVKDNHYVRERGEDSGTIHSIEQAAEEDGKDEVEVEKTVITTEAADHDMSIKEGEEHELDEELDQESANGEAVEELDETLEEEVDEEEVDEEEVDEEEVDEEEELRIDNECEQADESEHQQEDTNEEENSEAEPEDTMTNEVEQFVATKEKEASVSLPVENEVPVQEDKIEPTQQQMEEKLSQLPKFSQEWFLLKSKLVELRIVKNILDENEKASGASSQYSATTTLEPSKEDSSIASAPGVKMEQKRLTSSFYSRTHPNNKSRQVAVSSVSVVPSQMKDTASSVASRETVTTETTESSEEPPLTPTSIIEEDDVFEVITWAGPKVTKPKAEKEVVFSSMFGESIFSMDDSDTEAPFTGGINFDAPPRVPASALFSHAFIVNRGDDIGSPLFVVKKTLPNQNKAAEPSGYLQMEAPRKQAQESKMPKAKPALDMSEILLHQDKSLEIALSTESAWDTAVFANEVDAQADSCLFDALCGDSMCQGLINDNRDTRQMKEKADKPRRKGLFGKLRKKKRKDEAKMLGYGSLEDDVDDYYKSATAALAVQKVKGKKMTDASGFCPLDDEIDL